MEALKIANLSVSFLLELCILVALGYWGFHTGKSLLPKIGLGIGAPLLAAIVWGAFIAPKAAIKLPAPTPFVLGVVIFGLATFALTAAGQLTLAVVFAAIVVINRV